MKFQSKRELRAQISELQAKIEVYEMALGNAGLQALKSKHKKVEKEEFGFVCKKKK